MTLTLFVGFYLLLSFFVLPELYLENIVMAYKTMIIALIILMAWISCGLLLNKTRKMLLCKLTTFVVFSK